MSRTPDDADFRFGITRDQLDFLVRMGFAHGYGTVQGSTGNGVLDCQESSKLIVDTWIQQFKEQRAGANKLLSMLGSTPPIDLASLARALDAIDKEVGSLINQERAGWPGNTQAYAICAGTDHIRTLAGMPTKGDRS